MCGELMYIVCNVDVAITFFVALMNYSLLFYLDSPPLKMESAPSCVRIVVSLVTLVEQI